MNSNKQIYEELIYHGKDEQHDDMTQMKREPMHDIIFDNTEQHGSQYDEKSTNAWLNRNDQNYNIRETMAIRNGKNKKSSPLQSWAGMIKMVKR